MRRLQIQAAGFTLIELMVVVTVMLITLGGSIAAYVDFNDRQLLLESGKAVENALETARVKARTGDTPEGCVTLTGYQVSGIEGLSEVTTTAICDDSEQVVIGDSQWDDGVTLQSDFTTTFNTLHGGAQPISIELDKGGELYQVEVGQGGNISGTLVEDNQGAQ